MHHLEVYLKQAGIKRKIVAKCLDIRIVIVIYYCCRVILFSIADGPKRKNIIEALIK